MDNISDIYLDFCYSHNTYGLPLRGLQHLGRIITGTYYMIPFLITISGTNLTFNQYTVLDTKITHQIKLTVKPRWTSQRERQIRHLSETIK